MNAITTTRNYADLKQAYKRHLESKGFYVEDAEDGGLSFSLTGLGMSAVYAALTKTEIEYSLGQMNADELADWVRE